MLNLNAQMLKRVAHKQKRIAVRFDDSEFDCTYWDKVVDIQQKNGDLVVLNAYKRNGMKRKESWVHENEI